MSYGNVLVHGSISIGNTLAILWNQGLEESKNILLQAQIISFVIFGKDQKPDYLKKCDLASYYQLSMADPTH